MIYYKSSNKHNKNLLFVIVGIITGSGIDLSEGTFNLLFLTLRPICPLLLCILCEGGFTFPVSESSNNPEILLENPGPSWTASEIKSKQKG